MKKPIILAVVFGVLTTLFVALYLNSLELTYKEDKENVKVLFAKKYIDQGVILDSSLVKETLVPKEYVQPKSINNINDLQNTSGQNLFMTTAPIEKNEQILLTKLIMLGSDTGLSAIIPTDKRAITLLFDKEKIAGIIKPGNNIDIIGVFNYEDKNGNFNETSVTLLQNILILAVGKDYLGSAVYSKNKPSNEIKFEPFEGKIPISLSVTPQEAEVLTLASEKGTINFSLRPIGDNKLAKTQGTNIKNILNIPSIIISKKNSNNTLDKNLYLKEIHKKQNEAVKILEKYNKNK